MAKITPNKKPDGSLPLTPNNVYFAFQQFLVTWINIITKERGIYPDESYELRNSFNLQCPFNRHPDVINWNNELISDLMDDLCFKKIKLISLLLYDTETMESKERYILNLLEFLHTPAKYYDKQITGFDDLSWKVIYDEFRANIYSLLTKIRNLPKSQGLLGHNMDHKLSYTIVLETKDVKLNHNWVLEDDNKTTNSNTKNKKSKITNINYDDDDMGILNDSNDNLDDDIYNNDNDNGNNNNDDDDNDKINIIPLRTVDIGPIIFYSSIELI